MILPFLLNIPSVFVRLWSNPTENSENVGMLWKINKSRLRWLADVINSCFLHNREQIKHITCLYWDFLPFYFHEIAKWNPSVCKREISEVFCSSCCQTLQYSSECTHVKNTTHAHTGVCTALHVQYSIPKSNHAAMKHCALLLPIYQCYQGATCKTKPSNKINKKRGYKLWNNFRIMFLNMKVWIFLSSAV